MKISAYELCSLLDAYDINHREDKFKVLGVEFRDDPEGRFKFICSANCDSTCSKRNIEINKSVFDLFGDDEVRKKRFMFDILKRETK